MGWAGWRVGGPGGAAGHRLGLAGRYRALPGGWGAGGVGRRQRRPPHGPVSGLGLCRGRHMYLIRIIYIGWAGAVAAYCTYAARQKALRSNYGENRKKRKKWFRRTRAAPPSASTPRRTRAVTIAPRRGRTAVTAAVPGPNRHNKPVTPLASRRPKQSRARA